MSGVAEQQGPPAGSDVGERGEVGAEGLGREGGQQGGGLARSVAGEDLGEQRARAVVTAVADQALEGGPAQGRGEPVDQRGQIEDGRGGGPFGHVRRDRCVRDQAHEVGGGLAAHAERAVGERGGDAVDVADGLGHLHREAGLVGVAGQEGVDQRERLRAGLMGAREVDDVAHTFAVGQRVEAGEHGLAGDVGGHGARGYSV